MLHREGDIWRKSCKISLERMQNYLTKGLPNKYEEQQGGQCDWKRICKWEVSEKMRRKEYWVLGKGPMNMYFKQER